MTKLLVLSDSHGARGAIERILSKEQNNVDAVIFLGDGLRDLEQALAFFPHLRVYSVAGNCDFGALEPLDGLAGFDQTVVFYTHGHMYGVKYDLDTLADAAAARGDELDGPSEQPVSSREAVNSTVTMQSRNLLFFMVHYSFSLQRPLTGSNPEPERRQARLRREAQTPRQPDFRCCAPR